MADVIKLTTISRIGDSLILCASMDSMNQTTRQMAELNRQAQSIVKSLNRDSPPRLHVEAGDHYIIYICERNVCYLTICDKSFPKKLAIRFLEDIAREFDVQNGSEVAQAQRPYQFIKFDTFIQKTKKVYTSAQSQQNLHRVSEELSDVHRLMTKNINEILGRGEKLSSVARKSEHLVTRSQQYEKMAKVLNTSMFLRKYGIILIILAVVFLFVYFRFW